MAQSNVWVSLEREGLAANLQHYGNLIGEQTRKKFDVPEDWSEFHKRSFFFTNNNHLWDPFCRSFPISII